MHSLYRIHIRTAFTVTAIRMRLSQTQDIKDIMMMPIRKARFGKILLMNPFLRTRNLPVQILPPHTAKRAEGWIRERLHLKTTVNLVTNTMRMPGVTMNRSMRRIMRLL